ncbi:MAG: electron transfer flavoprotein beta subunit/FixA family protein [Bdellovibrionales bacterium]
MRIFVCIKQVPDTETKIKLKSDSSGIDETGIKWIMNPYDEYAVEEAIKIKEARGGTPQVTVVSVGPKTRVSDAIRTALAMGADDGLAIDSPYDVDGFTAAKLMAAAIKKEGACDLVLTGKLAIDDNASSVSQFVAEFLGLPHTTVVGKLEVQEGSLIAEREVEGGTREILKLAGPALIAANKGLNTPRYASLPGIMKAKKKPIKELAPADLGVAATSLKVKHVNFQLPPEKPPVKMISGDPAAQAKELVNLLLHEAKVL